MGRPGNEQLGRTCLPIALLMVTGVVLGMLTAAWGVWVA